MRKPRLRKIICLLSPVSQPNQGEPRSIKHLILCPFFTVQSHFVLPTHVAGVLVGSKSAEVL